MSLIAFRDLNPVVLDSNTEVYKKVAIVMNKLLFGQFPRNILNIGSKTEFHFCEKFMLSQYSNYGNSNIIIRLNKHNENFCKLTIDNKDNLLKVEINTETVGEPDERNYFLKHFRDEKVFAVKARSFLRYLDVAEDTETQFTDGQKFFFKTGDNFYSFLKFFEEQVNKNVAKICAIQDFNNGKKKVQISIADFCKACKNSFMEQNDGPSEEALKIVIDNLMYMGQSGVERISSGIIRIVRSTGPNGAYKLYFGGTTICEEFSVERFKYTFHPGIHLVARYLELKNKGESLKHKIERELFRRI